MCGFVAYLKTSDAPLDARLIEAMTQVLGHRGPDDFGMCFVGREGPKLWRNAHDVPPLSEAGVAMGHRRLSVFDLSEAGRQPIVSHSGRFTAVFNGEIYNYVELRDELIQHGFRFSTNCDTEVFIAAFEKWGNDCFNRLNGYWSFVIWDDLTKTLVASRDRLGEKPLYYARLDGDWIFASEVKALLEHPRINALPDEQALSNFIATGSSPTGAETYFSGIRSVEPATFFVIQGDAVSKTKYWDLTAISFPQRRDDVCAMQELDDLLTDAVRLRLRGDIRVGSLLSGGLDSTSVISCIAELLASRPGDTRMVGDTLQAFNASYPGMENDETEKVEELCRMLKIGVHKTFPAEQSQIETRLVQAARSMEAPFVSPAVLVYDMLMKLARANDVQVVLDGIGSDELFGGYDWYIPLAVRDSVSGFRVREALGNINGTHSSQLESRIDIIRRAITDRGHRVRPGTGLATWQKSNLGSDLFLHEPLAPATKSDIEGRNFLDHTLKVDLLKFNTPRWLNMIDGISMANSVMCRSPFLDFRLVEFAFTLTNDLKIRNGETKYILRSVKRDALPPSILDDRRKIQFSGPWSHWLRGSLKNYMLSLADTETSKISTVLRPDKLRILVDDFMNGKRGRLGLMWRIASAEAFLRSYS